jgi:predicted alpha/beta hydrolase family esterase
LVSFVKKEIEKHGFKVTIPDFPDTENPNLTTWLPVLRNAVGEPDTDTYLVGHSIGCTAIMRFLESLAEEQKVGGVVFVAGFTYDLGLDELKNFFTTPINYESVKNASNAFVDITSDNDPYVGLGESKKLKEKLGAEIILKPGMGHFSDPEDGGGALCTELPDVVERLLELSK